MYGLSLPMSNASLLEVTRGELEPDWADGVRRFDNDTAGTSGNDPAVTLWTGEVAAQIEATVDRIATGNQVDYVERLTLICPPVERIQEDGVDQVRTGDIVKVMWRGEPRNYKISALATYDQGPPQLHHLEAILEEINED